MSLVTAALTLASSPPVSLALFLDRGQFLLYGVGPVSQEVLWSVGLRASAEEERGDLGWPRVLVTKAGEGFVAMQTGLERLEMGELECSEMREGMYVVSDRKETWLWVQAATGEIHQEAGFSPECQFIPIKRLDKTIKLLAKDTDIELSQAIWSDFQVFSPCLKVGSEPIMTPLLGAEFLGYWWSASTDESLVPDLETVLLFVCISLAVGFRLGTKGSSASKMHIRIHRSKLNPRSSSDPSTATTAPCSSPEGSQKSIDTTNFEQDSHRRMTLKVLTMKQPVNASDLETPTSLHSSSEARICDLLSNGRFNDCFQDMEMLTEGQLRTEYRARHRLDQKLYLITVLQFHYEPGQKIAQTAMFREVAAMVKVRHKHIVNYVTCWVEEGEEGLACLYIQSQWIEGNTLKAWLCSRPAPDRHQNCIIFRQILKAISHIHSKNVVHRGIKPTSIYLSGNEQVTVGNFRFAAKAKAKSMTQSQELAQSLYAAPELASEATVSPSIDVYPLGLVLLELCEGHMTKVERRTAFARLKKERELPEDMAERFPIESELILQLTSEEASRPEVQSLLMSTALRLWEQETGCSPRSSTPSPRLSPSC